MSRRIISFIFWIALISSLVIPTAPAHAAGTTSPIPAFVNFTASLKDGQAGVIRGLYAPDLFALKVAQQPANDPYFVAPWLGTVTDFKAARDAGNIGLLAHNYLAGQDFPSLKIGQELRIVYGDGRIEYFKVTKLLHYQALQSKSVLSNFVDQDNGEKLTWPELFKKAYQGAHHLTLQTCIEKNGDSTWGRLFVIAEPFTP